MKRINNILISKYEKYHNNSIFDDSIACFKNAEQCKYIE